MSLFLLVSPCLFEPPHVETQEWLNGFSLNLIQGLVLILLKFVETFQIS
jgi:hypothetical protein